jgi:hypothetical protein
MAESYSFDKLKQDILETKKNQNATFLQNEKPKIKVSLRGGTTKQSSKLLPIFFRLKIYSCLNFYLFFTQFTYGNFIHIRLIYSLESEVILQIASSYLLAMTPFF